MQILSRIILCASSFHSFIHLGIHSFFFTDFLKGFCNFIDWMVSFEFQESLYLFKVFIHSFMQIPTFSFFLFLYRPFNFIGWLNFVSVSIFYIDFFKLKTRRFCLYCKLISLTYYSFYHWFAKQWLLNFAKCIFQDLCYLFSIFKG